MSAGPWRLRGDALAARGEQVALVSRDERMTYAELSARAASVWRVLKRTGVLPGHRVALVSSGRALDEPVGLAGILTSGAVAVPLDGAAPPHRLARVVKARGCRALVLDAAASGLADGIDAELGRLVESGQHRLARVVLDAQGTVVATAPGVTAASAPGGPGGPGDPAALGPIGSLACVLHTSGSTGEPKPVPITWAGLDAFTAWMIERTALAPGDRVLRVAELIFDLAWFDHLATLRAGATLALMARRDLASAKALLSAVRALAPAIIYTVPSFLMKLRSALPEGEPLAPTPRAVLYAGEVFPPRELQAFAERAPGAELYNLFGPTETNVCTYHRVERDLLDGARETPIGVPCPYARCALLAEDGSGRVIEGPGTGELVVEGPTVVDGGPYATRDRVERGADGLLYFRGRIDRMVKIRGYRVDPGEVEAALGTHPAVRLAAVVALTDPRLGKELRAFVELRPGSPEDTGERSLRVFMVERLPAYMVPTRVLVMAELPRTTTGKIDYKALEA